MSDFYDVDDLPYVDDEPDPEPPPPVRPRFGAHSNDILLGCVGAFDFYVDHLPTTSDETFGLSIYWSGTQGGGSTTYLSLSKVAEHWPRHLAHNLGGYTPDQISIRDLLQLAITIFSWRLARWGENPDPKPYSNISAPF